MPVDCPFSIVEYGRVSIARIYFEEIAPTYNQRLEGIYWSWFRHRELRQVETFIDSLQENEKLLDAGCGTGFYGKYFEKSKSLQVSYLDISPSMLGQIDSPRKYCEAVEVFALQDRFQTILCFGVLEFCENPQKAIENCLKHLLPQGALYLIIPRKGFTGKVYQSYHRRHGVTVSTVSKSQLDMLVQSAGGGIEKIEKLFPFNFLVKVHRG